MAKATRAGYQISRGMRKIMKRFLMALALLPQEELDLDKLFKKAKWNEIKDVTDVAYEVEIVTPVAGVRGDEAEDEILNYLYYIIDTKTRENSLKINKIW